MRNKVLTMRKIDDFSLIRSVVFCLLALLACTFSIKQDNANEISIEKLRKSFVNPPDSCKPGVYWYFMDDNLSREGITGDLESMKAAGIGNVIFLEVNVGDPRGKVDFLSEEWMGLFKHAVKECERLGIELTLGSGPEWAGSGGPWVKPGQSMRHLVASVTSMYIPILPNNLLFSEHIWKSLKCASSKNTGMRQLKLKYSKK